MKGATPTWLRQAANPRFASRLRSHGLIVRCRSPWQPWSVASGKENGGRLEQPCRLWAAAAASPHSCHDQHAGWSGLHLGACMLKRLPSLRVSRAGDPAPDQLETVYVDQHNAAAQSADAAGATAVSGLRGCCASCCSACAARWQEQHRQASTCGATCQSPAGTGTRQGMLRMHG